MQYCGTYIDKNGENKPSTPDLVIAKNWNWLHKVYSVDYRSVVEVKSPYMDQSIYNKEHQIYGVELKKELKRHLTAKNNSKVILTDTLKWEFYERNVEYTELIPIQTIVLYDLCNGRNKWNWKKGKLESKNNDVISEVFGGPLINEKPVKEFEELKDYIIEFLYK